MNKYIIQYDSYQKVVECDYWDVGYFADYDFLSITKIDNDTLEKLQEK